MSGRLINKMIPLQRSDCKDLVSWFKKFRADWGKAASAEFVRDDVDRGPVYAIYGETNEVLGYGWFGADGDPRVMAP